MKPRQRTARAWSGLILAVTLSSAACSSGTQSPPSAGASLRTAVQRSIAKGGAELSGSMTNKTHVIEELTGRVNFQDQTVQMRNAPGAESVAYSPYETSFVDGWNYIPITAGVHRPSGLRPSARWVAFRNGYRHDLPVPGPINPPATVLRAFDALLTAPPSAARFDRTAKPHTSRIQVELPRIGRGIWTVSINPSGVIDGLTDVFPDGSQIRFRISYGGSPPTVKAPPANQVQRLTPDVDLYPTPAP